MIRIIVMVLAAVLLGWLFWQWQVQPPVATTHFTSHGVVPTQHKTSNAVATVATTPEVCFTRAQLTADPEAVLAEQWLNRNLPDPSDLPTQARTFTVAQLEAEAASGDVDAMFKLGVKYLWAGMKPHRDQHLNASAMTPDQQLDYAEKSRFWFWQAALHGRLQAFFEISLAENARYQSQNNSTPSPEITPLSAAYRLLMQEINPNFARAVGVRSEHILLKAEDQAQVAPLLATLRSQWQQQRQELGQPFKLDLPVPDYVTTFEQKLAQLCASEWSQPAL